MRESFLQVHTSEEITLPSKSDYKEKNTIFVEGSWTPKNKITDRCPDIIEL